MVYHGGIIYSWLRDEALTQDEDQKEDKNMTLDRKIWIYQNLKEMAEDMAEISGGCDKLRWLRVVIAINNYYEASTEMYL